MLRIKELRLQLGMSQQELADRVDVTQSQVSNWEAGRRYPYTKDLPKLARALDCTISDLFVKEHAS